MTEYFESLNLTVELTSGLQTLAIYDSSTKKLILNKNTSMDEFDSIMNEIKNIMRGETV